MKAFLAAIAAIVLITLAGVVVLEIADRTSAEATAGANVRLD